MPRIGGDASVADIVSGPPVAGIANRSSPPSMISGSAAVQVVFAGSSTVWPKECVTAEANCAPPLMAMTAQPGAKLNREA